MDQTHEIATPHFIPDWMNHSFVPFDINVKLSYCFPNVLGEHDALPSIVSVPPGLIVMVDVQNVGVVISALPEPEEEA